MCVCVCAHSATSVLAQDVTHSKGDHRELGNQKSKIRGTTFYRAERKASSRETHIDAEGNEVVRVEEVVRDWLSQVEGQLDELEGRARIRGGEDDPASVVHHRDVCCQYHLSVKID